MEPRACSDNVGGLLTSEIISQNAEGLDAEGLEILRQICCRIKD
jgi:hypothetical protein